MANSCFAEVKIRPYCDVIAGVLRSRGVRGRGGARAFGSGEMASLFSQVKGFSKDSLKSVETHITTPDGKQVKRSVTCIVYIIHVPLCQSTTT